MRPANCAVNRSFKSRGFALILIVLVLLGIGGVALFASLNAGVARGEREIVQTQAANDVLIAAKLALVGFVVSSPDKTYRPGTFPTPDSLGNGIYDGWFDPACLGTGTNGLPVAAGPSIAKRCLGKLPWKYLGFDLGTVDAHDPLGRVPWLAVSANLVVYDNCLKVLNSEAAALNSPTTASCPTIGGPPYPQPTTLPHPWLTVVNENGTVLSDRVAAVLIMPGAPSVTESRNQQRSAAAPGHPADYLDDIKLPLGCATGCTIYDNAGLSNVFVSISPGTTYPSTAANAATRGQKIPFNDVLVYLTIDELMPYAERRVVGEMAKALATFKASAGFSANTFPWLAPLVATPSLTTSLTSVAGTTFGMLPFMADSSAFTLADFRSDFDWQISGFTETLSTPCQRIGTGPNRYIRNSLTNSVASPLATVNLASGTVPVDKGVCQWRGTGRVSCSMMSGQTMVTTLQKTMPIYSNNTCTALVGNDTLDVSRTVTRVILDTTCASPTVSYTAGTASDVHRWSSVCSSINVGSSTNGLDATEVVSNTALTSYNRLPRTYTMSLVTPVNSVPRVTVNRMRYHPIMPGWFHESLWYRTAFAALAPNAGPASITPCGTATTLTVDGNAGVQAVVIQAGARLPAVNAGVRPSMAVTDYLEGQNSMGKGGGPPGITNCTFDGANAAPKPSANDQLLVVAP